MCTTDSDASNEISLTSSDIYLAAEQGVLPRLDAERLVRWGFEQRFHASSRDAEAKAASVEHRKGLNFVTVAYYLGAMLMILACAWFLGDKWEVLGSPGILITVAVYTGIAAGLGWWLRETGFTVGGGLLITVAVCMTPLLTYAIEDLIGVWPTRSNESYDLYYPWINASRIPMELATLVAAAIALRFVRFGFLTAPIAFAFLFLSFDLASLISRSDVSWNTRRWITVAVGLVTILVGYALERLLHKPGEPRSEDFAFWCYLLGMLAFWGGLTSMNGESEIMKLLYALLNVGFIALAVKLRRTTFLVFGALGLHLYLAHLAYEIFENSFFFPFVLALLGLSLILFTVWLQRNVLARVVE